MEIMVSQNVSGVMNWGSRLQVESSFSRRTFKFIKIDFYTGSSSYIGSYSIANEDLLQEDI